MASLSQNELDPVLVKAAEEHVDEVLDAISRVLERICKKNAHMQDPKSTLFQSKSKTTITIQAYCRRLCEYMKCSLSAFVCAVIYIDRVCAKSGLSLTDLNVHRVLLAGLVVSIKFWDDTLYVNTYYAEVGGVPLKELNSIEQTFLSVIDYDLAVDPQYYAMYFYHLTKRIRTKRDDVATDLVQVSKQIAEAEAMAAAKAIKARNQSPGPFTQQAPIPSPNGGAGSRLITPASGVLRAKDVGCGESKDRAGACSLGSQLRTPCSATKEVNSHDRKRSMSLTYPRRASAEAKRKLNMDAFDRPNQRMRSFSMGYSEYKRRCSLGISAMPSVQELIG